MRRVISVKERGDNRVGFLGLLTILFIGLKLTNYISWSWWWVLSPTIIPLVLGFSILIMLAIIK